MSGPAVDSDAWIKQSNKRCFTGGMKAVAPLGVLRDSDGKPIARSGEGWVEGTGEPPMRLEDIVTKAKAEAREAQWPDLVAFGVNPSQGVQVNEQNISKE